MISDMYCCRKEWWMRELWGNIWCHLTNQSLDDVSIWFSLSMRTIQQLILAWTHLPGLKLSARVKHGDTAAYAASTFSWNVILLFRPPGINFRCLTYTWRNPKRIIIKSKQRPMMWRIVLLSYIDNDCMVYIVLTLKEKSVGITLIVWDVRVRALLSYHTHSIALNFTRKDANINYPTYCHFLKK